MEVNITGNLARADPLANEVVNLLSQEAAELALDEAELYYDFPVLRNYDGTVVRARILVISRTHGIFVIAISEVTDRDETELAHGLERQNSELDQVCSLLYSRLIRNSQLRRSRMMLAFPVNGHLLAPLVRLPHPDIPIHYLDHDQLRDWLQNPQNGPMSEETYKELVATIEGAKGIVRPRLRVVEGGGENAKGYVASRAESEIFSFDERQKHGAISVLDGFQRIRGLAGSGKTVVLAMKAAQMHLRHPEADIVFTFYTKSLYQHIQRLITRFYRQYDDRDPDWNRLRIMHAWGGASIEGVYSQACAASGVQPIPFGAAYAASTEDPFDKVCQDLMTKARVQPMYDYVFVDEGQDFPPSFIRLCLCLARGQRVVYAYDDLQTIWRTTAPTAAEITGTDGEGRPLVPLSDDTVLYKCYRNPREVLVCAHALGFGIYGSRIVQMLQNREHWEDLGYLVLEGTFQAGSHTVIERPVENSLQTISRCFPPNEIVCAQSFGSFEDELNSVVRSIQGDIADGLRPDDILVVAVDDRYAKPYLNGLGDKLSEANVRSNNIHGDPFGVKEFYKEGHVTLSTVHKAKGNEGFMVYVVGMDALFASYAGPRERNMLFTAMTRAKGWVRMSGVGPSATVCVAELDKALSEFPRLVFSYPNEEDLKVMKRDLEEQAVRKLAAERALELAMMEMTPDEIQNFISQRAIAKGRRPPKRRKQR